MGSAHPVRLSDGRIVVEDSDEWPLKIYSPEGGLLARFRKGGGPQELPRTGFRAFATAGDTIIAGHFGTGPVKVIDPSLLRVVRIVDRKRPDFDTGIPVVGKLDDGRWLVVRMIYDKSRYPGDGDANPRYEHQWVLYEPDFSAGRVLLHYPGAEVQRLVGDRDQFDRPAFGAMTVQALHDGRLYVATNHAPEIEVRDTTGQVTLRIRVDLPLEPVTARDREDYARASLEFFYSGGRSPNPRTVRDELRETSFASTHAFFEGLTVGAGGSVWAALARRLPGDGTDYWVFSAEGALLATASLPPRVWLHSVWPDVIVVTMEGPYDEYLVKVVPIRR